MSALHLRNDQQPRLTMCGRWASTVDLAGDDFDPEERYVCAECSRVALLRKAHDRILRAPQPAAPRSVEQKPQEQ